MKKVKLWLFIFVILTLYAMPAYAETVVNVEGKEYHLQTVTYQDSTLIPLRDTSNLLGAKVNYLADVGMAFIEKNETQLRIHMGDTLAYLNNQVISSGIPPVIVDGKAYVPLRFLAESLNYDVANENDKILLTGKFLARVHFIDVGFGDAIFIQLLNNKNILIDAGDNKGGGTVATYLKKQGVKDIDLLISTVANEEHMAGLGSILRQFGVKRIISSNTGANEKGYIDFKNELKRLALKPELANGQEIMFNSNALLRVYSHYARNLNSGASKKSVVCSLKVGEHEFLFMGDNIGQPDFQELPKNKISVLKVGDHASFESTPDELIKLLKPDIAIVTVGTNGSGLPNGTTLSRIKNSGAQIYRTDANGTIVLSTNGKDMVIEIESDKSIPITPDKPHHVYPTTDLQQGEYLGDKTTGIYHHPACEVAKQIPQENWVWFIDKLHAENSGYVPDEVCDPK